MNEAIELLESIHPEDARDKKTVLLDTSFLIYELNRDVKALKEFCAENNVLMADFNLIELSNVEKHNHSIKRKAKKFFEERIIRKIVTSINPGEWEKERKYALETDPDLLRYVHDASDAVLVAAAIKSNSDILTRDKHHLFTAELENKLSEYNTKVFNDISSYKSEKE